MKEITFSNKTVKFDIPEGGFKEGQKVLFMGTLKGMTGGFVFDRETGEYIFKPSDGDINVDVFRNNIQFFLEIIRSKAQLYVLSDNKVIKHFWKLVLDVMWRFLERDFNGNKDAYVAYLRKNHIIQDMRFRGNDKSNDFETYTGISMKKVKKQRKKFDYIIQNPPYNGSLHLDFLAKGLDLLSDNGRMVIIEPATWLINVRKYGKRGEDGRTCSSEIKKYDELKERLKGNVESVAIETRNEDFGTGNEAPSATITIDMSKPHNEIEFIRYGEEKMVVKSLYDCNLVGDYNTIWSILDKVQKYGDTMKNHITENNVPGENYYIKYSDNVTTPLRWHNTDYQTAYGWDSLYYKFSNGEYFTCFGKVSMIKDEENCIYHEIPKARLAGGGKSKKIRYSDTKNAKCVYGTLQEMKNWEHFIYNNKLPLFINILMTLDRHNNSLGFLPWLVDKQYTDEEINKLFGFTDEEIALIDRTIKKYERNSPWFKRYMCGPGSVDSDPEKESEIINNFVNSL